MILHPTVCIWTDESNFDRAKQILVSQFGLVAPQIADAERIRKQLVWEDPLGVGRGRGRYRVNFSGKKGITLIGHEGQITERPINGFASGPSINFRYWAQRLDDITKETDPMRQAYLAVYSALKPVRVTDIVCRDINLEGL